MWNFINIRRWQEHQFYTRVLSLTFLSRIMILIPFLSTTIIASIIYSWIVQRRLLCANDATENLKISRQLFFNTAAVTSTDS